MCSLAFREVTPYADIDEQWNDITINAGASQSTLQDIKLPEVAGCFTYQDSRDLTSICSNRFIYWRTNHDVIELVEVSLDVNLQSNRLRLRFQNTPILRGTSIHEHNDHVVLLVATVSAIHKLVFPHPKSLESDNFLTNSKYYLSPSIFFDTTSLALRNRSCNFVLNNVSIGIPLPHTSCSWLNSNGSATFILANSAGSVLMVVMSNKQEVEITTTELMKTGSISRWINGLVPTVMRNNKTEVALSIVCHDNKDMSDVLIFSLFSDLQIRIWSNKKQDCILADSILNYGSDNKVLAGNFTAHQCHLRKSAANIRGNFYLGVYVPIPHQKIFYVFQPIFDNDRCKLSLVTILHQTNHDLVDFCIGEKCIWTLWLSCENQPIVLTALFDSENKSEHRLSWLPVSLEPRVSSQVDCGSLNIQDQYLKEIFKVGRFLPSTISKAISIFSSSRNLNESMHTFRKSEELKKQVIETVMSEIMMIAGETEIGDEIFVKISKDSWSRFFSYCIQYHEVGMKPLGISLDPKTGSVVIVKKNFFSLLCPCDSLDILMIPSLRSSSYFMDLLEEDDKRIYSALMSVLSGIDLVEENFDPKQLQRFNDRKIALESTLQYALEICESLDLEHDSRLCQDLQSLVPSGIDAVLCLQFLLKKLDLSSEIGELSDATQFSTFAGSTYGIGALCAGLSHFAKQRFDFCRNMLLFTIALWRSDNLDCEHLDGDAMKYQIVPTIENLLRSYYIVWWSTVSECSPVSASIQDAAFKQFCVLELPEFIDADLKNIKSGQTVCYLFFQEEGGVTVRKLMESRLSPLYFEDGWKYLFPSLVISAANLLWPGDRNVAFPEFLFTRCQYIPLLEYDSLLQVWSPLNKQFLNFLVATSCLILGDSQKALKIFFEVSKKIEDDTYFCNKWIKRNYSSASSVTSQVCMRVVRMLEQFSLSECIVNFTGTAVNEISKNDPNIPIFYSILFKHNLNLNRTEEAFVTLINNPDPSRRKDCLRQLVVRLCETKQFQKIIELSYEEEIVSILESRARCSDLCHNTSFYGVLYALHIDNHKFRKAATVMYELAMRYSREVVSLKGLKKQVSCYLAVINCLHLAEPQYAWIVKPAINVDIFDEDPRSSPKRNSEGCEVLQSTRPVKVEVLGLPDIVREYNLVQARLTYVRKYGACSSFAITPLTAEDTVALLLDGCLFEQAILLSKSFSLSLVPVFEALTYRCISSMLQSDTYNNDEFGKDIFSKASSTNVEVLSQRIKVQQHIWDDLQQYLLENELDGKTELHRCVTEKLLANGATVPAWLKLSYQKLNFTEMLALYITYGFLEESVILLTKYIKAVLGVRREDFNMKFSLHVTSPAVWLPHTYIDILLDVISSGKSEHFKDICEEFNNTLEEYNRHIELISSTKLSNCMTYA
ncbi:nuclear pore complex protein Nup160 [Parasteatoda tepidariorum]|nr:nuclear pore complex protein Nup160 [Parasteatoda tepidariorum]